MAGPDSNDIEDLRDIQSNQTDFENIHRRCNTEHTSLLTELEILRPETDWIAKYFSVYGDSSTVGDEKPISPSKTRSFPYTPSRRTELHLEAEPSRTLSTLNTDPPLSYTHASVDPIPPLASAVKDRQAFIGSSIGHDQSNQKRKAFETRNGDYWLEPHFLLQYQIRLKSANKEIGFKSGDEVEKNILQDQAIPLSPQAEEESAEHKQDGIDESSRLKTIEIAADSTRHNCKVSQKSPPLDPELQLQDKVPLGQRGNLLAMDPNPPRELDKNVQKEINLQTVSLAQDSLLQADKDWATHHPVSLHTINEDTELAEPETALDEGCDLGFPEIKGVDEKLAQTSTCPNLRMPRKLRRQKSSESTVRDRVAARTSRPWGLQRFLQYHKAPNSVQPSGADGGAVQSNPKKQTQSSGDRALVNHLEPVEKNSAVRKDQTWYEKVRALRVFARVDYSNEEAKLARNQAKTAKQEENHRKQEKKAREAAAAKAEKSRQRRLRECAVCLDTFEKPQLIRPCDHYYCLKCLAGTCRNHKAAVNIHR